MRTSKSKIQDHSHFVRFNHDVIDSPAFKKIGNSARVVYLLLLRQKGTDAGAPKVKFPYKDARQYINGATFSKAVDELCKFGFIELETAVKVGSDIRQPNVYVFSPKWKFINIDMVESNRYSKSRSMKGLKEANHNAKVRLMFQGKMAS